LTGTSEGKYPLFRDLNKYVLRACYALCLADDTLEV
jgi:hypothetical protein